VDRSGPYPIVKRIISTTTINGHTLRPVVASPIRRPVSTRGWDAGGA
jgi:hypothetical protein